MPAGLTKICCLLGLSVIDLASRFSHSQLGRSIPLSKVKVKIEKNKGDYLKATTPASNPRNRGAYQQPAIGLMRLCGGYPIGWPWPGWDRRRRACRPKLPQAFSLAANLNKASPICMCRDGRATACEVSILHYPG